MSNLKKVSCVNASFFILEGDLVAINDGEFPITYLGLRFADAPKEQIWIYDKSFFGFFTEEESVVSSHSLVEDLINNIKKERSVNIVDDYITIESFKEDYKPYGSQKTEKRSSIKIVKEI